MDGIGGSLTTAVVLGLLLVSGHAPASALSDDSPITVRNRHLALGFDPKTGAWTSLVDLSTADELVVSPVPRALVPEGLPVALDRARVARAIDAGQAIDLSTGWEYTPTAPSDAQARALRRDGHSPAVAWVATPVSSRRGTGDDRLHDRSGTFFYRRSFPTPPGAGDRVLVIGAVDDFDTTYLNGQRIGATDLGTPRHWEAARYYRVPEELLRKDRPNELRIEVTNAAYDGGLDGPIVFGGAKALMPEPIAGPPLISHELARRDGSTVLTLSAGRPLEYRVEVRLPDDGPWFSRQISVTNRGDREEIIERRPVATSPPLRVGPSASVAFPGSLPVGDLPLAGLLEGEARSPRSRDGLAVLWDQTTRRGLGAWYFCEEEFAPVSVARRGEGAEVRHTQEIIARLGPGRSVSLGRQFFWLAHGSRDAALSGVQAIYREVGLKAPEGRLPGLASMVIYNGHPGGVPEKQFRGYGGFTALERYLPTLEKMHVDLLWMLPIWEHGDGRRWNLYAPFDHFQISPLYGTPDELKRLSRAAGERGIRPMFDLVPHGPPDFTPLAKAHPDWVSRERDGSLHYEWGQYAFDNANPEWQDYMRRAAAWGAHEFGAVGARVDCGAGSAPNWGPPHADRPSLSTLAAGLGMNRAVREGYRQEGRPAVVLPEEYTGANVFNRVADLTYDAQLYFLMMDLHARQAAPAEWAGQLRAFLRDQQATLPPGALKMRWISNHDTVSWTFQKARPLALYGVERMRALLALCAFVEGAPMLYQGDEDPSIHGGSGPSNVDFLARIYGLRKSLPALREGTSDYLDLSPDVVSVLRTSKAQRALVLISLNPEPTRAKLPSSPSFARDAMTGAPVPMDEVPMGPHQVRVLVGP